MKHFLYSAALCAGLLQTSHAHAADRELAVPSPVGPLPGTLTMPSGSGPFPVVLLLAGSGPNDRDETIGSNKPFLDIATGLAEHGIATLRYDKRTRVFGAGSRVITVDDEVTDDAVAALQLLAKQPAIDATRVFVLGHSLGGLMAPRIAERVPGVAGVILFAAPVTFDLDTVLRQIRYITTVQHVPPEQSQQLTAQIVTARDAIAKADPAHPPAGEYFHAPASYWLSFRGYDPVAVAKNLRRPLLILQGGRDYQVTPKDDFAHWQTAFAHDKHATLKEYPELYHLFMQGGDPPSPADYAKAGHVDATVISDIADWIAAAKTMHVK